MRQELCTTATVTVDGSRGSVSAGSLNSGLQVATVEPPAATTSSGETTGTKIYVTWACLMQPKRSLRKTSTGWVCYVPSSC